MKIKPIFLLNITLVIILLGFFFLFSKNSSSVLKVIFLDVGQGDAALIITPQGKTIVIDTGPEATLDRKLASYLPLTQRTIDMVFLTHPDLDHISGSLNVLRRFQVQVLFHSGLLAGSELYDAIAHVTYHKSIPTYQLSLGDSISIEPGLTFEVFSPSPDIHSYDANDFSLVMRMVYKDTSILFTGDATKFVETDLVATFDSLLESDILKVGHHGSQTSTSANFLDAVNPEYAILSYGCDNNYGHPHRDVVSLLYRKNIEVLDTCMLGDIIFETDGSEFIINER